MDLAKTIDKLRDKFTVQEILAELVARGDLFNGPDADTDFNYSIPMEE